MKSLSYKINRSLESVFDRFLARVRVTKSECWEWQGNRDKDGYGRFRCWGIQKEKVRSHRAAWILFNGPIPDGLNVLHKCDNPPRCNPEHLFLGTNKDNTKDRDRKGRTAKGDRSGSRVHPERVPRGDNHPFRKRPEIVPRGPRNGNAKLNWDQVREIRRIYRMGGVTQTELAKRYDVTGVLIGKIVRHELWKEL